MAKHKSQASHAPLQPLPRASTNPGPGDLGIVMGGGGARAAYQVGFLRCGQAVPGAPHPVRDRRVRRRDQRGPPRLAPRHVPAGGGRAHPALGPASTVEDVFRTDSRVAGAATWCAGAQQLLSGRLPSTDRAQPGRHRSRCATTWPTCCTRWTASCTGIALQHRAPGASRRRAISTSSYTTGQSMTWVQGKNIETWERPHRRARMAVLTVEHVMASTALPLFFPAVQLEDGVARRRQHPAHRAALARAPPGRAAHHRDLDPLPAHRRGGRPARGARLPAAGAGRGRADELDLPRPARSRRAWSSSADQSLLEAVPDEQPPGLRPIKLLVLRPSVDLGTLAYDYEPEAARARSAS